VGRQADIDDGRAFAETTDEDEAARLPKPEQENRQLRRSSETLKRMGALFGGGRSQHKKFRLYRRQP
jgi:transposase-like protein